MRHCFAFFSCALLVTSCCCLYHLSADDETSNVLKRSVKNVRSRFGSLLYIKINLSFVFTELDPNYAFSKFFETLNRIFINEIPMKKVSKTVSDMWFDGELRRLKKLKRKNYFIFS